MPLRLLLPYARQSAAFCDHPQPSAGPADRLVTSWYSASSVRNTFLPLRAIYRRASERELVAINPTLKLRLPAVRGKRERIARAGEAANLVDAVPERDRALWVTAVYAGLLRGELQALDWTDIDFDNNVIEVVHAWDQQAGLIGPKSRAGERRVPKTRALRRYLLAHKLRQGRGRAGFVFARNEGRPFEPAGLTARARAAWREAHMHPISLHECRHTYAAFMIAAGVNMKALSTYMGYTSITVTLDRYGHLLPGNEHHAATLLDNWLEAHNQTAGERSQAA